MAYNAKEARDKRGRWTVGGAIGGAQKELKSTTKKIANQLMNKGPKTNRAGAKVIGASVGGFLLGPLGLPLGAIYGGYKYDQHTALHGNPGHARKVVKKAIAKGHK